MGSASGEVDIFEGVNDIAPNSVTLHTAGNCTMPSNRTQLGYVIYCSLNLYHILNYHIERQYRTTAAQPRT